ncbi:myosin heavy chain 9/10/11/14 [Nematocida parisii]|nr:myosin heavy chain 9/10/11/14 [Nematocida parisii]KAI5127844.1 myosin heavy chain 9/10/11/14 [Nematocida parisii]KAI5141640.1 myosin heavy chain 9/10/11/14 [Nematocida parisii]
MNKGETKTKRESESEEICRRVDPHSSAEKLVWWMDSNEEYHLGRVIAEDQDEGEIALGEKRFKVKWKSVQKANPSKFDLVDNMAHLSYLNEPSILHNLKQRYFAGMQYTYSGLFLVAVNPYKNLPIYTKEFVEKYSSVYKREDAPPHIYAVAGEAYHLMRNTRTPQTILITGESGAGKTENTKHAIAFLTKVSGELSQGASILEERLVYTNPLLEAFGNARTEKNDNSSRFGKFIKIEFGVNGEIVGAFVERYLLESSRVTSQARGERNYHVFYALTKQADQSTLDSLHLERNKAYRIISETEGQNISIEAIYKSMDILGFTEASKVKIFKALAAIIHLGEVRFEYAGKYVDVSKECADELKIAAELLGVDGKQLKETLLYPKIQAGHEVVVHGRTPEEASFTISSLCKVLYERLFNWIVSLVNISLQSKAPAQSYIGVLDIAGFEILENNGFEQLCINYTNEKLQQFFNHRMFILEQEVYLKEGLEWNVIDFGLDLQPTIDLLETSGTGIFSLLDEECVVPGGSGERLLDKITRSWRKHEKFSVPKVRGGFEVEHYAGKVKYNEDGWISKNKDPLDEDIASLMLGPKGPLPMPSIRSGLAATRFRTVAQSHKEQLAGLLKMLYTTNPHFVRCILPNREKKAQMFEDARVLHQLRCNGVLEGVRISRQGFPTRIEFREFTQRYALLSREGKEHIPPSEKGAVALLSELCVPSSLFKLGRTRLFLRQGVLADLEDHRNAKISGVIVELQKRLRILLNENLDKIRKKKEDAVSLIQKNIKIYAAVRNWSWWKLCMKVRPLLEVRKTEDEIKERDIKIARQNEQIQELLDKINSLESEYSQSMQEIQKALAQSEKKKTLAEVERTDVEKRAQDLKDELAAAQKASNKHYTQSNEMKKVIEGLEVKVEQARKDAASEVTKKLLSELAEIKILYGESLDKNKSLQKQLHDASGQIELVVQERDILAQERDSACEKNKKLSAEVEDLQNEIKVTESLRYKGEISLRKSEGEIERLQSLLNFEKEKLHKLNEAFKKSAVSSPAPSTIVVPPKENKEELIRLQKELEHEKERSSIRQKEYEELKAEYIDLIDERLGTMISDKQKMDTEIKKLQQAATQSHIKLHQSEELASDMKAQLESIQEQMKEEKQRSRALLKELAARKDRELEMVQNLADSKKQMAALFDKLQKKEHTSGVETEKRDRMHSLIINELRSSLRRVDELTQSVVSLSDEVTLSMDVISLYKAEIRSLSNDLVLSNSCASKAQQQLNRAHSNLKENEQSLSRAISQIQALAQEKEKLLEEVETELYEQRERHEHAEIAWQKEKKALQSDKRALEREVKEKERANASLLLIQQEKDHLQTKLSFVREEIQKCTEEKESACADLIKKIQTVNSQISKEKAETDRCRREAQMLKESLARAESALKEARLKESVRITELSRLEESLSSLHGKEKECLLEIRRLELEISARKLIERPEPRQILASEEKPE